MLSSPDRRVHGWREDTLIGGGSWCGSTDTDNILQAFTGRMCLSFCAWEYAVSGGRGDELRHSEENMFESRRGDVEWACRELRRENHCGLQQRNLL